MVSIGPSCSGKLVEQISELAWPNVERRVGTRNFGLVTARLNPMLTAASKPPAGRTAWRNCGQRGGRSDIDAIDRPGWWSSRWSAEISREGLAAVVNPGRPSVSRPAGRHGCHDLRIGDLARTAFDNEIEVMGCDAQHAARVSSEVLALARTLAGLEPERAVSPQGANSSDVWAAVRIDRGQPARVAVRTARVRHLGDAFVQRSFDLRPVEQWQVVKISKVCCVHTELDRSKAADSPVCTVLRWNSEAPRSYFRVAGTRGDPLKRER